MSLRSRLRCLVTAAATGAGLGLAACTPLAPITHPVAPTPSGPVGPPPKPPTVITSEVAAAPGSVRWGAYTGPGSKGVSGARQMAAWSSMPITESLDFANQTSWLEMTRSAWQLTPYADSGLHLEYSVPMLPDASGVSLGECAAGGYDGYWRTIAQNLVAAKQSTATVRPGWEMNGDWYKWNAAGQAANYIGCFRHIVTTMRGVAKSFRFDWNPNIGLGSLPAEQAYPGDAYVDYVGLDVYDTSWTWYPQPAKVSTETARLNAWNWILKGDHGLLFWRSFSADHGKSLALTEYGSTWRGDGHGGGDNPFFIDKIMDFITDPANHVAYAHYFDNAGTPTLKHDLMRPDTVFPEAAARFRARCAALPR